MHSKILSRWDCTVTVYFQYPTTLFILIDTIALHKKTVGMNHRPSVIARPNFYYLYHASFKNHVWYGFGFSLVEDYEMHYIVL